MDINALNNLKNHMDKLKEQRTATKAQLDTIEQQAISQLMALGVRYVDASGTGEGPFWVLGKSKTDGTWNRDRYIEFFGKMMQEMAQNKQFTPAQLSDLAVEYLRQFEKRTLVLNKLRQCRVKTIDDLKVWLAGGN